MANPDHGRPGRQHVHHRPRRRRSRARQPTSHRRRRHPLQDYGVVVDQVTSTLSTTARSLPWSGPAADAFAAHHRTVIERTDQWHQALAIVVGVIQDHHTALTHAQDTAQQALLLWNNTRQQLAQAPRWDTPGAALASNYNHPCAVPR